MSDTSGVWTRGTEDGRPILLCCPHSGGSARHFREWQQNTDRLAIRAGQYPGRHDRINDALATSVNEIAAPVVAELRACDIPIIPFGHSMGAVVAFEIARRLIQSGNEVPGLVVSAHRAPLYRSTSDIHLQTDDEMWRRLAAMGGTAPELLQLEELRNLYTPILRADLTISTEFHDPNASGCLDIPVIALAGQDDTTVSVDTLEQWRDVTTGPFTLRSFVGGHFYLDDHVPHILGLIQETLELPPTTDYSELPWV